MTSYWQSDPVKSTWMKTDAKSLIGEKHKWVLSYVSHQCQTPDGNSEPKIILPKLCIKINEISTLVLSKQTRWNKANRAEKRQTGLDLDHVNSISSWITYDFSAICRWPLKILCIKNTAPSAPQHQNLFICLRSCLLCFFSLTSSGADGFSAMNHGPRKFTQSKCTARAGAWHTHTHTKIKVDGSKSESRKLKDNTSCWDALDGSRYITQHT